jgi:hypothetical protein
MATVKSLQYSKDYKRHERETNASFVQKEKLYRRRYAKRKYAQSKIAVSFCEAHSEMFTNWLRTGTVGAPSSAVPPKSRILQTVPERSSTPIVVPAIRPMFTPMPILSISNIPSATAIEANRLASAGRSRLAELGIRLD